MREKSNSPIRRDWIVKTLAGFLFGAVIGLACSGLFSALNAGMPLGVRGQLAMWMLPPIWLGVLSGSYFFASGVRACLWLGGASLLAWILLFAVRA